MPHDVFEEDLPSSVYEQVARKDSANGYAGLDSSGLLKTSELPSSIVTQNTAGIPWVTGTSYTLRQFVYFAGALYICTTAHTAGANFDQTKWTQVSGGGEIAYGQNNSDTSVVSTSALTAISGCQVAIPAGCGPYMLEFWGLYEVTATAAAGGAQIQVEFIDETSTAIAVALWLPRLPSNTQIAYVPLILKFRMPATATAKTITVKDFAQVANATANRAFSATAPAYIQAYSR